MSDVISRSQIGFEVGGRRLVADVLTPKGKTDVPFVLFLHDGHTEYARSLAERGYGTFSVDVSGHSEAQAKAAFDALFELPEADAMSVFVVGRLDCWSLAVRLADARPVAGVVLGGPEELASQKGLPKRGLELLRRRQVPALVLPLVGDLGRKERRQFELVLWQWLEGRLSVPAFG